MHLEKNRTYACTFPVHRREINVVKVLFTMRYFSRKLSNDNVITTACNFWRQISCSFQVIRGNILFLGKKIFEIPPFFQTRSGDLGKKVDACSLRFSALKIRIDHDVPHDVSNQSYKYKAKATNCVVYLTYWGFHSHNKTTVDTDSTEPGIFLLLLRN